MVIFFAKLNLESVELLNMYGEEAAFDKMRASILAFLKHNRNYEIEEFKKDENGNKYPVKTNFRLMIGTKKDDHIIGRIIKSTRLFYKDLNATTNELESHSVPTMEEVTFYYDANREMVAFHTRLRFGRSEFIDAFEALVNQCMEENESPLRFTVNLYNEGMDIKEIEKELDEIKNIKELKFKFRLPNPADDIMLEEIRERVTDVAEQLKEANAHTMSTVFDTDGKVGLNIKADEIKKNINMVGNLTQGISAEDATKNSYAVVEATSLKGNVYTTMEKRPVTTVVPDGASSEEFVTACKDTIWRIFIDKLHREESND
ncbi:hypothetical protein M2454_003094 [Aequitasia blattaphilus]|uniref:DUF4747 domain-containing protein n=1 Tax=Aequitasia blattaphilus TaxID=2949332 RepID=A0ABT1EDP4_9FIRM|nr:hypothetical protein [Aequitasia blattaphilus]MCP1103764.1 hypothetical protein [Aequitasia blattaphilus]MCR8616404.1 hypothetical protein [Aequitasia blattaphilus]